MPPPPPGEGNRFKLLGKKIKRGRREGEERGKKGTGRGKKGRGREERPEMEGKGKVKARGKEAS